MHSEVAGDGPPVVFVHAAICDSRMWDPQWDVFRRDHRVVRCDLAGFGQTPLPVGRYSLPQHLIDLLDELALGPAALVGASLGGGVSLQVAVARPDLVSALVLVGSGVRGHEWSEYVTNLWAEEEAALERGDLDAAVEVNLRGWLDGPDRSPERVDPKIRDQVAAMQRQAFELWRDGDEHAEEEALVLDVGARLSEIAAPALVLVGEHDVPDIHAIAARLERELPRARRVTIGGTGHLPSMERPAEFNELVLEFLAEAV
jgi:3-oxoadipate enol-lactonase